MKYIGTKEVEATPMTAKEAAQKGYRVSNNAKEDGYEVIYKDGYKSWSPKEVFDEAYRRSGTYRDRMVIEYEDLQSKYRELNQFLNRDSTAYPEHLDKFGVFLAKEQLLLMERYMEILKTRFYHPSVKEE